MNTEVEQPYTLDGPLPSGLNEAWERLLSSIAQMGNPQHATLDVVFSHPLLFPLQRRREAERMLEVARSIGPKVVLDVGSDKGASTYMWCSLPTVRDVIACEIRGTPYSPAFEKHFSNIDFLWLPRSSYNAQTVKDVGEWLGQHRIDVMFLDGDKSFFDRDANCYLPFMSRNGVIFVHDITDEAPRAGYDRIIAQHGFRHQEVVLPDEWREIETPTCDHHNWLVHWKGQSCGVGIIYLDGR